MIIEIKNWFQLFSIFIGIASPMLISVFTIWYNMKRTNEIIRQHTAQNTVQDRKLHEMELQQVKLIAEVDGLAGKIFTKLDSMQDALSLLNRRLDSNAK